MMIEMTRVSISVANSKPKIVLLEPENVLQVDEHEDARDPRVTARITYKVSEYQTSIMYVTDPIKKLVRRVQKAKK